ncbi:MAG: LCP family protein [Clostridia bacterium]|nr:LCP family protein [Clostridia bacterium]
MKKINTKFIILAATVVVITVAAIAAAFTNFYRPTPDNTPPFNTGDSTTPVTTTPVTTTPGTTTPADTNPGGTTPAGTTPSGTTQPTDTTPAGTTPPVVDPWGYDSDHYNFLVLGHDAVALNTDVLMLVSYNVREGSLAIMQIPRDTYVKTEVSSYKKINSIYPALYVKAKAEGESNPDLAALKALASILEQSLCIRIHNSAIMDLTGFANIVDAVGGVTVDVPYDMIYKDPYQDLDINIPAGVQTLNGELASQFIRFRADYKLADITRINVQKIFMTAFIKQVKENISVSSIAAIAEQAVKYVKTDMKLADLIYYAKSALSIDLTNVTMMTLPGSVVNYDGLSYYVLNKNATIEAINNHFNIYNTSISATIFDQEVIFNNADIADINFAYSARSGSISDSYRGDEIDGGEVEIK